MCGREDDPTQHDVATCDTCGQADDHNEARLSQKEMEA